MKEDVLETYIQKHIESQPADHVTIAWQGGEPTLMGVDFYKKAMEFVEKYRGSKTVTHTMQTNGTLLNDEWAKFLARHKFLVGLSIDGPKDIHDRYRFHQGGKPSHQDVIRGLEFLKKHNVDFNAMVVVGRENAKEPLKVYNALKSLGFSYFQFMPLVERLANVEAKNLGLRHAAPPPLRGKGEEGVVTPWTVLPEDYGDFLIAIFNEWLRNDVGRVFVMNFEWALAPYVGTEPPNCFFARICGNALIIEHNGDIYSCDHFMYPDYHLGNIMKDELVDMLTSPWQVDFGEAKERKLPPYCLECKVLNNCRGECPKHRFIKTPDGEPGLNYLCRGYKKFFLHAAPHLEKLADNIVSRPPVPLRTV